MLNLYAVLNVSSTASDDDVKKAIDAAEQAQQLPQAVLQSARFYLLNADRRRAYHSALEQALQKGTLTTDWATELAKQQENLPMLRPQQNPATTKDVTPDSKRPETTPPPPSMRHQKQSMKGWHWCLLIVCLSVTGVLVVVLWEMAQVQMHQNQQITTSQKLHQERRLPENWPTWLQKNGETYLISADASQARLSIHKNATQDLPVLSLPKLPFIDCGERGNQTCAVTFVFDGQDPHTYTAQIIGTNLIFNNMQQLPVLMHELSRATRVQTSFPNGDKLPELVFGRDVLPPAEPVKKK